MMVNDVLEETRRLVAEAGVESADDVRQAGRQLAGFSAALRDEERQLKAFLYARMYDAPAVRAVKDRAQAVLAGLFAAYSADPALLPEEWRPATADPVVTRRAIGDFIAGMTDRYAIRRYEELVGPALLPEGF
jgi:dGTPase